MDSIDPQSTLPWRVGKTACGMSVIVSDQRTHSRSGTGHDDVEFYGGHLVAESIPDGFAKFIVDSVNATMERKDSNAA